MTVPAWLRELADAARTMQVSPQLVPPASGGRRSAVLVLFGAGSDGPDLLFIQRSAGLRLHPGQAAFPGGAIDLGESMTEAAIRETLEETGITCEITGLVGIYTDPRHIILYTSNGEARQEFSIVLTARYISGRPTPSSESDEVRWADPAAAGDYQMDRSMRMRISDFLHLDEPRLS